MNEIAFVERREPDWQRLTYLSDKADSSLKSLSSDELGEFVRLYRKVSADLAVARTKSGNLQLSLFLNDLVARAYGILYREPRGSVWSAIAEAVKSAAQTVRRRAWFVLASALLLFGSAIFAYGLQTVMPRTRDHFVPPQMEPLIEDWRKGWFPKRDAESSALMTAVYATNNPRVSIIAGSVAASTFGIGTAYLLYSNGALLGTMSKELEPSGMVGHFLISVAPHGVTELSGIVISGAAGLVLGWALINPGRRRRGEALLEAGKDTIVLLCTAVAMMLIAAPIEGFFSFNPEVPDGARGAVALVSAIAWGFFWVGFGRVAVESKAQA